MIYGVASHDDRSRCRVDHQNRVVRLIVYEAGISSFCCSQYVLFISCFRLFLVFLSFPSRFFSPLSFRNVFFRIYFLSFSLSFILPLKKSFSLSFFGFLSFCGFLSLSFFLSLLVLSAFLLCAAAVSVIYCTRHTSLYV